MSDIAIAHDQFRTYGGAERVAVAIARTFDAPIYAMRVEGSAVPDDVEIHELADGVGGRAMRSHHIVQDAYQMLAWQHTPALYEYDTVVQTKTNPGWYVPKADEQTVIRYLHSTPRGLYDLYPEHGGDVIGDVLNTVQRALYAQTTPYADHWICNSDVVEHRLHRYLGPTAPTEVIYPPVDTGAMSPSDRETGDYLFTVGRLAGNKRIGLLKAVARAVDRRVLVAGDGPEKETLLQDAPPNLRYLGYIDDEQKARRLSGAAATLFLAEHEDFGIVPIESMAAGTPVIGVSEGFTKHQIQDRQNGYLCEPDVESVTAAVDELDSHGVRWSDKEIAMFAGQFSEQRFRGEIHDAVTTAAANSQPDPEFATPDHDERVIE